MPSDDSGILFPAAPGSDSFVSGSGDALFDGPFDGADDGEPKPRVRGTRWSS